MEKQFEPQAHSSAFQSAAREFGKRSVIVLLVGDIVTLLLFTYIGQRDHELIDAANPLAGVLKAFLPFLLAWLAAAFAMGAYKVSEQDMEWRTALGRGFMAWMIAAPLGVVLRALWLDRAVIPTAFLLAAFGFGGAMLLTWRILYVLVWHRVRHRA